MSIAATVMPEVAESISQFAFAHDFLDAQPGVETIKALVSVDPGSLGECERLMLVQAWERQASWVAAQQQRALAAAVHGADGPCTSRQDTNADVATGLGLSHASAARRIDIATGLTSRLPVVLALVESGRWTVQHAAPVVDETAGLTDRQAGWVDAEVAAAWHGGHVITPAQIRRFVKRAVIAADTQAAEQAQAAAVASGTEVAQYPEADGMATIAARLPADDAQVVWKALTAHGRRLRDQAHRQARDTREARDQAERSGEPTGEPEQDQQPEQCSVGRQDLAYWRAKALVDLSDQVLADPDLGSFQGKRRVEVGVVVSLDTLLKLNDDPADLTGYGPIPAPVARDLAADGVWRRWVADPVTGHLLDYGRTTYRPPQRLVDYLVHRDPTCTFPGCGLPSW
ncbi:MAG TPA: DUF222 domain-containing protein, partial [Actinomycetes bacterium]|nr:DUF222 domain-containing protein [Actinomycetes bacterium]